MVSHLFWSYPNANKVMDTSPAGLLELSPVDNQHLDWLGNLVEPEHPKQFLPYAF